MVSKIHYIKSTKSDYCDSKNVVYYECAYKLKHWESHYVRFTMLCYLLSSPAGGKAFNKQETCHALRVSPLGPHDTEL